MDGHIRAAITHTLPTIDHAVHWLNERDTLQMHTLENFKRVAQ